MGFLSIEILDSLNRRSWTSHDRRLQLEAKPWIGFKRAIDMVLVSKRIYSRWGIEYSFTCSFIFIFILLLFLSSPIPSKCFILTAHYRNYLLINGLHNGFVYDRQINFPRYEHEQGIHSSLRLISQMFTIHTTSEGVRVKSLN